MIAARLQHHRLPGGHGQALGQLAHLHHVALHRHLVHLHPTGGGGAGPHQHVILGAGVGDGHEAPGHRLVGQGRGGGGRGDLERAEHHLLRHAVACVGIGAIARHQREHRRGVGHIMRAAGIRPVRHAIGAGLHRREEHLLAALELPAHGAAQHELVVMRIGQVAAAPDHRAHAFGHHRAVVVVGRGIGAHLGLQRPPGLGHRLHRIEPLGDLDADGMGCLAVAAVGHAQGDLAGRTDRGLGLLEGGMGMGRSGHEGKAAGGQDAVVQHCQSP